MLSKTHRLTEALTTAIGPVLREHPDYEIIQQAMGLVIARIAQSTPETGREHDELEVIYQYAKQALTEFLRIEAAKKAKLDEGINGFAAMFKADPEAGVAALNGGMGTKAQAAAEEAQESQAPDIYGESFRQQIQAEEAEQAWHDTLKEPEDPV
jgi:hypothetical protein